MTKKNHGEGVAENYAPVSETLNLKFAKVVIDDCVITYDKKLPNGQLYGTPLKKKYPSRHAVQVILGRLKKDNGAYLLRLMQKIENEQLDKRLKKFS